METEKKPLCIENYMKIKNFNELSDFESILSILISKDNIAPNKVLNSVAIKFLFNKVFEEIPTKHIIYKSIENNYELVTSVIKKEISRRIERNEYPSLVFDEWSAKNKHQYISTIIYFSDVSFNLGLIQVEKKSNADHLLELIISKLNFFGITYPKFATGDGAAVNISLAQKGGIKLQKCINHGLHLSVVDFLYKQKQSRNEIIDFDNEVCETTDIFDSQLNEGLFGETFFQIIPVENEINHDLFRDIITKIRGI